MNNACPWRGALAALTVSVLCPLVCAANSGGYAFKPSASSSAASVREPYRLDARLSPDGRWLAVTGAHGFGDDLRCWVVPLESGVPRELHGVEPAGSQTLGWDDAGLLRLQTVDREHGVPEMRWIDVASDQVVRSTRDRDVMRAELRAGTAVWATVEERRGSDRRALRLVSWRDAGRKLELQVGAEVRFEFANEPGLGFVSSRADGVSTLTRFEVGSGATREIARSSAGTFSWTLSPDGRKLALWEQGHESRVRVIDSVHGTLLHGPWMTSSARWLDGGGSRYLASLAGERRVLFDLLRDRELDAGPAEGEWPTITALADGRFVVEDDRQVTLYDADFRRERELFIAPVELSVARR